MGSNKVAFTAVGLACIAAAGTGGYFALRQNAVQEPAAITAPARVTTTAVDTTEQAVTPERSVQETDAVVAPREKGGLCRNFPAVPALSSAPVALEVRAQAHTAFPGRLVSVPELPANLPPAKWAGC